MSAVYTSKLILCTFFYDIHLPVWMVQQIIFLSLRWNVNFDSDNTNPTRVLSLICHIYQCDEACAHTDTPIFAIVNFSLPQLKINRPVFDRLYLPYKIRANFSCSWGANENCQTEKLLLKFAVVDETYHSVSRKYFKYLDEKFQGFIKRG
jgi:hypothetical protein